MKQSNKTTLKYFGLPTIESLEDLSFATHVSKRTLFNLSKYSDRYYKSFSIPKKCGGERIIAQPSRTLKGIQGWILVNILNKLSVSLPCKGFEKGSSISDNVAPHIGANIVICMDLKDFFPSVSAGRIQKIFQSLGYNSVISYIFTKLCTYEGRLPQGGPCSPKLANLAAWNLDSRIQGYVGKRGITYTRYADDLTFSGASPSNVSKIIPTIRTIIQEEGFLTNENKTRTAGNRRQKRITGLVLTDNSFGIGKKSAHILRAKIHKLSVSHLDEELLNEVKGWLAYTKSVDLSRYKQMSRYIEKLSKATENESIIKLKRAIDNWPLN